MSGPFLLRARRHRLCAEAALLCFDESSFPPSPITVSQTGTVSFILRASLKIKRGIRYLICPRQRPDPCPSCPCCFWIVLIACWNILRFTETNVLNPRAKHRLYKGTKGEADGNIALESSETHADCCTTILCLCSLYRHRLKSLTSPWLFVHSLRERLKKLDATSV